MDQGLKERLVGAAVLVAIAVWLVPWVLDGPEGGAETPPSSLQLPSAEEPMPVRTQILKLGDAPEPTVEAAPAPSATQARAGMSEVEQRREQLPGAVAEPKAEAESTLVAANSVAQPTKPAAASTPPPKPEAAVAGDWTVQLGSFEDEANARRLAQRAGSYGYKAEVSSSKSGARTLYRVRVGPQATKAAAEAAASALRAHGVEARVVAAR
jgi:DedD protein